MTNRSPSGEALTSLILEIFRTNGQMLNAGNKLTEPYGLTSARWQVIGAIDEEGQALTVSQIARRMGLARQGVQRIINDLEKVGLVESMPNIDHKRAPLFAVSEEGEAVMIEIKKAQAEWVNALAEGISVKDLRISLNLLQTVRERSEEPHP